MPNPAHDEKSMPLAVPSSPFSTILNFRDIGLTINLLSQSQLLNPSLIYRSARPDEASADDIDALKSHCKIQTIIDLRSKTELAQQDQKLSRNDQEVTAASTRLGCHRVHIDLNGGSFAHALMKKLSWLSYLKLIALYVCGWRTEAIRVLGTEVMQPRGLIGLATDSLDYAKPAIGDVFNVLSDPSAFPILVHCTQGKDRTGLIIILLLLMLNVSPEVVDQDYRASPKELIAEEPTRLKEIRAVGLDDTFAGCPEGFVESVIKHITDVYGGSRAYLKTCGVSETQLESIQNVVASP